MQKTYFISDLHLGLSSPEEERAKETRLISFLDHIKENTRQLFIVGDLFDAWFEYRTVIPKGFHRTLTKLNELTDKGIIVHYLAGNHDYWIRDYFRDELGMKTYHDPIDVTIDGKKIHLHHGDGLAANDTGYRILKVILRNPFNIWLYSWLHPDIGVALARSSSKKSRHYTSGKDYGEHDGMVQFATGKINEGYDIVIMGHRHQPAFQQIGKGLYINLGDWVHHNTYAELENGIIQLKEWK
jgi:UDP-2,3-diacylglucosamine hydrolase